MSRPNGKKPAGGRPVPKRLFSLDSLRKDKSSSSQSSDTENASSSGSTLRLVEKSIPEDGDDPFASPGVWTEKPLVTSPGDVEDFTAKEKGRKKPTKPTPLALDAETGKDELAESAPPPSPSKRRWDTIRYHVMPTSSGTETPPRPSSPIDPAVLSSARPSTPKGYRFGQKRHVRQVVDEARAVDEVRKFSEEIQSACWAVRFGEGTTIGRPEREGSQNTVGSGVHLPFSSSSASIPMASNASVVSLQMSYKNNVGPRRPPSIGSIALSNKAPASVAQIARALTSTTSSNRPRHLPHEQLIWSALLTPFLTTQASPQVELERGTAVETFQLAIKTWGAQSPEVSLFPFCCTSRLILR